MVDRYYRKIEDVENDIENTMQISSILLKLKENDKKLSGLSKIDTNENNISNDLEKINDNGNSISNNLEKIDNFTQYILKSAKDFERTYTIEKQIFKFNEDKHFYTIFEKVIEHEFIKNSLLFVKNNTYYKYDNLSKDINRTQHEYNIYDSENSLINKYLFNKDVYYDKNLDPILNTTEDLCICFKENYDKIKIVLELHRHNRHGYGYINLEIDDVNKSYINIDYIEKGFLDNSELITTNTSDIASNSGLINTNTSSILSNLGKINTNTSCISSNIGKINTNTSSISSNLGKINTNTSSISSNLGKINTNTSGIASNLGKIGTNKSDISDNSGLIHTNKSDIASNLKKINDLQNSNIKAFYNLDKIFIYDIEKGYQIVNKDNHYHIFEKEITYDFTKNSYLEIILKVLTEVSNYVLIGYFQILCNFYDQDNLFYTISLSTAAGSINKLSTVKSVFIVPINENMSKIKIDFFIAPKATQQNRSAKFVIQDININKIYVKYFQKTEDMSIKNIQDSLNNVNSISTRVDNLEKSIYLKNLFNTLYHDNDIKVSHIFFDKTYTLNAKKNDFLEINFKLLLEYNDLNNSKFVDMNIIFYNMNKEIYNVSFDNDKYKNTINTGVLLHDNFNFIFDDDVEKLKIAITFSWTRSNLNILYKSVNTNQLIIKHYST